MKKSICPVSYTHLIEPSKEKSKNVDAIEEDWDYDVNDDNENGDKPGYPAPVPPGGSTPPAPGLKPVPNPDGEEVLEGKNLSLIHIWCIFFFESIDDPVDSG